MESKRAQADDAASVASDMSALGQGGLLSNLDFSSIEEMDPSTADGHRVVYDRECPFEMRVQHDDGSQEVGAMESVKVKVLLKGETDAPESCRVELCTETDLFFHFTHALDETTFRAVQEEQKLTIDFASYSAVIIKMLNECIREPERNLAVFIVFGGGTSARLDFIQNMHYKFVELLSCSFVRSPDEVVQQQITYRYNAVKSKLAIMQSRLHDVNRLLKSRNPSLLLQLGKGREGAAAAAPAPASDTRDRHSRSMRSIRGDYRE